MKKSAKFILILVLALTLMLSLSLIACRKDEGFKVSFMDGDSEYGTISVSADGEVTFPDNPEKEGQVFEGWELEDGTAVDAEYFKNNPITADISIRAKFYYLNDFEYDTEKLAIKVSDRVNANLFGASLVDSDGNQVDIEATIEGDKVAGKTVSVNLVATGKNGLTKTKTIENVKVYGTPSLTYDKVKKYFNKTDELTSALFNAKGTDSFGVDTTISISVKEDVFESGDNVTVVLASTDILGNKKIIEVPDVEVYDKPTISFTKKNISTLDSIDSNDDIKALFDIVAEDSFGNPLSINIEKEGKKIAGKTMKFSVSAQDSKGNSSKQYIENVKIYGPFEIEYTPATFLNFANGYPTVNTFNASAKDSFGQPIPITFEVMGEYEAGKKINISMLAEDGGGNSKIIQFYDLGVYDKPTISVANTNIKVTDEITDTVLGLDAKDSFGNVLGATIVEEGVKEAGKKLQVRITATDSYGNTNQGTFEIKVYGMPTLEYDVTKTYFNMTNILNAELFSVVGQDSFGVNTATSVSVKGGGAYGAGSTITLVLTSTDAAGNTKTQEVPNIRVYGEPIISFTKKDIHTGHYIGTSDALKTIFSVSAKDSFEQPISAFAEIVNGEKIAGTTMTFKVHAQDEKGNYSETYIEDVKVYAAPTITYDTTRTTIAEGDTMDAIVLIFNAIAQDSFNEPLAVTAAIVEGTQTAGQEVTITFSATDKMGNKTTLYARNITVIAGEGTKGYTRVNESGEEAPDGRYVLFGEYPQTYEPDASKVSTEQDSRGYYKAKDGTAYYAKVTAAPYETGYKFSDKSTTIVENNVYYFKVEPIKWRILNYNTLSDDGNKALLFCDNVIANMRYNPNETRNIGGETIYPNNYKESEIRAWLTNQFINIAFNTFEETIIETTNVDNSEDSVAWCPNPYVCSNTQDKIFLPSFQELKNTAYGFNGTYHKADAARSKTASDYSRATGAWINTEEYTYGKALYWTRTPSHDDLKGVYTVSSAGPCNTVTSVFLEDYGIVPMLKINL